MQHAALAYSLSAVIMAILLERNTIFAHFLANQAQVFRYFGECSVNAIIFVQFVRIEYNEIGFLYFHYLMPDSFVVAGC